jgi:hypothetical protein
MKGVIPRSNNWGSRNRSKDFVRERRAKDKRKCKIG